MTFAPERIELTILMPCLNEAETLEKCIAKAHRFLQQSKVSGEVLIADNGSTDGSQDIAIRCGATVVQVAVKGYGAALKAGIAAARGVYVIMGDADDSYDFSNLMPFVEKLRQGNDLVIGNRFKGGIAKDAMPFLHKYLGNPALSFIGRLFYGAPVGDFHCGLRGFSREAIQNLHLNANGMEFASEMVVKATLHHINIAEVTTTLAKDGRSRAPHLRTWRDGWRHLVFLLLHCPRWLYLLPGTFFVCAGTVLMLALLPGPLNLGSVTLDVHTLVVASAMIDIGVNVLMFWFLAKQLAIIFGILPRTSWDQKIVALVKFEWSLVTGAAISAAGVLGLTRATMHWAFGAFGRLNYEESLRQVVPSTTLTVLGLQIIFFAFFLSLMKFAVPPNE